MYLELYDNYTYLKLPESYCLEFHTFHIKVSVIIKHLQTYSQ